MFTFRCSASRDRFEERIAGFSVFLRCYLIKFQYLEPYKYRTMLEKFTLRWWWWWIQWRSNYHIKRLRWSRGCGFKPGRSRRIFQGENIPSTPSFGEEVKPAVPCRRFTACKRSLNVTWNRHLGKILGYSLSPIKVPPVAAWISRVA
jgi:hypothetical protein